jgi:hypothetical protein
MRSLRRSLCILSIGLVLGYGLWVHAGVRARNPLVSAPDHPISTLSKIEPSGDDTANQLANLRGHLKRLEAVLREENPKVIGLRKQIQELEEQQRQAGAPDHPISTLSKAESSGDDTANQLASLRGHLKRLEAVLIEENPKVLGFRKQIQELEEQQRQARSR